MSFQSKKQAELFNEIAKCGDLLFACGPKGVSANIYGSFSVVRAGEKEDRLDMGNGTQHVHIDWSRIKRVEVKELGGEGILTFFDKEESLFKLYRFSGPFSDAIARRNGINLLK